MKAIRRKLVDPRIVEHRGRIVKTTGDGLLVEFASVANVQVGRLDEARAALGRLPAINPGATIARFRTIAARDAAPEYTDLYVAAQRLAGLPEG